MQPRISVLTLAVSDLEGSLSFYRDGLGLPTDGIVGQEFEHGAVAFFDLSGGLKLAIWAQDDLAHDTGPCQTGPIDDGVVGREWTGSVGIRGFPEYSHRGGSSLVMSSRPFTHRTGQNVVVAKKSVLNSTGAPQRRQKHVSQLVLAQLFSVTRWTLVVMPIFALNPVLRAKSRFV